MDKLIEKVQEVLRNEYGYIIFNYSSEWLREFIKNNDLEGHGANFVADVASDHVLAQGLAEEVVE